MATNYKIGVEVELDVKNIQKQLDKEAKKILYKPKIDLKETQLTVTAANAVFREAVEVMSLFVQETVKLDAALTEFRKVSTLSGQALDEYAASLGEVGKQVGKTTSQMVDAATQFKKSGFSDEDAANLALVATKYQNIADEQISAGESANFIVSQMKAFGIAAKDAEHIIDAVY